jgi:hypothetical protein
LLSSVFMMYCTVQYGIFARVNTQRYGECMGNLSNDSLVHTIGEPRTC